MQNGRCSWLQLTEKVQQAYSALSSEDSKNFTKVKEAIFKHYDINKETYRRRFRSAMAKGRVSYQDSNPFNGCGSEGA